MKRIYLYTMARLQRGSKMQEEYGGGSNDRTSDNIYAENVFEFLKIMIAIMAFILHVFAIKCDIMLYNRRTRIATIIISFIYLSFQIIFRLTSQKRDKFKMKFP